jgi:U3 small nucleolar RNA-associated protein 19
MAAASAELAVNTAVKRKRQENGDHIKKRRKSAGSDSGEFQAKIEKLEAEIHESKKNYNNIVTLNELVQKHDEDAKAGLTASEALCRVFIRLLAAGNLVKRKDASEKEAAVANWLRDRLADYKEALLSMFRSEKLALNALMLALALLKAEARHLSGSEEAVFPRYFLSDIVAGLLESPVEQLREHFSEKFVDEYDDIRFYTFEAIKYG